MRCINKRRRRGKRNLKPLLFSLVFMIGIVGLALLFIQRNAAVQKYEDKYCSGALYQSKLLVDDLCVATENVLLETLDTEDEFHSISIMKLDDSKILHAENIHEKIYPASTTKLMTAYLAFKYGNLEDEVIITESAQNIPIDSSRAGLRIGDKLTLLDLLYGLLLPSGNDAALAIAEYISGSVEEFVSLMNEEAKLLGATNTQFVNPHGYHDDDHFTTAYDLYLMFAACMKHPEFTNIISSPSYELEITQQNGTYRIECWTQTNWYVNGNREQPSGAAVIGGKTGTTDEAGSCLITLLEDENKSPYLAVIMGSENRYVLYDNMDLLINTALQ